MEGNRRYQDGDFAAALDAYLAVERSGFESGPLFYNIANAYFKTGALGRAILYYERASRELPGDEDVLEIKVGDFVKKSLKVHRAIGKRHDFKSRRRGDADGDVRAGDYGRATQALLREDGNVKLEGATNATLESLPSKNYSQMSDAQREELFSRVDDPEADQYASEALALQQIKRLKRSRSPGVDGA